MAVVGADALLAFSRTRERLSWSEPLGWRCITRTQFLHRVFINTVALLLLLLFFSPSVVKIPKATNMKLKSKVGMVLQRRKQSYRALRPNWPRVFGINMTSRASRRRYTSQAFAQSGEEGESTGTERIVGFDCDWLKNIRVGEAHIFRLFTTGSEVCCGAVRPCSIIIIVTTTTTTITTILLLLSLLHYQDLDVR